MDITFLGHSSFKIKGRAGSVVIDPFDPKIGLKFPPIEADIVTISHNHSDHNNLGAVKNYKKAITGPGEYEVMGISIIGIPTFHDDKKGEEKGKNTVYVYEVDGLRICHLGDLGHKLTDQQISEIGDIDILMVPTGGVSISIEKALEVVGQIEPHYIIPMHYLEEGLSQEVFGKIAPVEDFLKESGLTVEKMPKFSLKKEEIIEDSPAQIIVLEAK